MYCNLIFLALTHTDRATSPIAVGDCFGRAIWHGASDRLTVEPVILTYTLHAVVGGRAEDLTVGVIDIAIRASCYMNKGEKNAFSNRHQGHRYSHHQDS